MKRPSRRTLFRILVVSSLVTLAGALVTASYPYLTDLRALLIQRDLRKQLESAEPDPLGQFVEGAPITQLVIPSLKVDTVVVEGTSSKALASGAGHYRGTPLPGEAGNIAIAGHRTMYGKPFANVDRLRPGDEIHLITPAAKYTYRVSGPIDGGKNPWVVAPTEWSVIAPTPNASLTLTTCHPKGSAALRLIVRAELVS